MLDLLQEELEQLEKDLQEEQTNLKQQQQQQERTSSTVTGQMCQESQVRARQCVCVCDCEKVLYCTLTLFMYYIICIIFKYTAPEKNKRLFQNIHVKSAFLVLW